MPNKIESFNSELTRVQLAVTRVLKAQNATVKKEQSHLKQKTEYFNSPESLEDLFIIGERYDHHFQNRNNGIGKRQFDELKKSDPSITRTNVKKIDLENDGLNKISQRLSECHKYYAYNKEMNDARIEMQAGDKPQNCTSLQSVEKYMTAEQIFPFDAPKKLKDADWIIKQIFKMLDKNEIELSTFMIALGKDQAVLRYYEGNKIVKEMGKVTTGTLPKIKNKNGISLVGAKI